MCLELEKGWIVELKGRCEFVYRGLSENEREKSFDRSKVLPVPEAVKIVMVGTKVTTVDVAVFTRLRRSYLISQISDADPRCNISL